MFKELVSQIKRLFSSKKNGAKLVNNLTDRLHYYKQVLLATSIVLLLGYSQFRGHFRCVGTKQLDEGMLTDFCWINGTYTLDARDRPTGTGASGRPSQADGSGASERSRTSAYLGDLVSYLQVRKGVRNSHTT